MRRVLAGLATALVVGAIAAATLVALSFEEESEAPVALPQSAMPGRLLVGFQDDASLRWAPDRAELLDRVRATHASVIRTIVVWATTAPERPADPANPFDPAYQLDDVDDLVRSAQQRGIELLLTIWGTPAWANGGEEPNISPSDPKDLEAFARALADRYSGRHPGYPAVRMFSAWNEPNLEQFLSPQFDEAGRSIAPALYAPLARAVYDGVKDANPEALVAIGETSPRGHDVPSRGRVQDSHSPARFARLLSEERPRLRFDAWAQHPYPPHPELAPGEPVRWPRVGLDNIERFGQELDGWFDREGTPLWVTEYGHETRPADPLGVEPSLQARFADEALSLTSANPRVRVLVWFIFRDTSGNPWQSGVLAADGTPKPALERFTAAAKRLDARHPVLPEDAEVARVPALELAYDTPAGDRIEVRLAGRRSFPVPLRSDGWLEVSLDPTMGRLLLLHATDKHGHVLVRRLKIGSGSADLN